jgi:Protein of unknown function (DUF1501)
MTRNHFDQQSNLYDPSLTHRALADADIMSRICRRSFLRQSSYSVGGVALAGLLQASSQGVDALVANKVGANQRGLHFPSKVRRVIHLCMSGGPSHMESFDPKPELDRLDGKPFPESFTKGQQLAQLQNAELKARKAFCSFTPSGKSGIPIADIFPHIQGIADEICVVRSMHTEQINHDPALAFINSGSIQKGRPSMGSWLLYGIGAETENLPGFVVMVSKPRKGGAQPVSARQWSAGFLPSKYQGIQFQTRGDAVHYIKSPEGVAPTWQAETVQQINRLNRLKFAESLDPEIETRISQYEMAYRMQTSVPDLTDMSNESPETLQSYGVKEPGDGSFASNCLLARRLVERGVRMVQLYHRAWDHHSDIVNSMTAAAEDVDQATAALVKDLKQRGMLDETLIIWGGEFGRTPMGQGTGRDHHINAFSIWLAGGGVKAGMIYGQTDELGYRYIDDGQQVHVRDLHATLLHLFGIDHQRFTFKFLGLDARLTGVEPARVIHDILT